MHGNIYLEILKGRDCMGVPMHKYGDNVKLKLLGIWCECMGHIELAEVKVQWCDVVKMVKKFLVPQMVGHFWSSRTTISVSLITVLHGLTCVSDQFHCGCCYQFILNLSHVLPKLSVEVHLQIVT
jgi:hypothetical protein